MKKKYLFLILSILYAIIGFGQIAPNKDKNWVLNTSLSDEFNGTIVDTAKWKIITGWHVGSAPYYVSNVAIEDETSSGGSRVNRILRMKAASKSSTGGIESKNANYLYGYYEMRARLPGYFNTELQQPCSRGFWTAFWAAHQVRDSINPKCIIEHNEIDIVEPCGYWHGEWQDDAQTNEVGHHMLSSEPCNITKLSPKIIKNLPPLYENFHKFAAECLPDRIIYYFDDVPFHTVYGLPFPNTLMKVVMNNQLCSSNTFYPNTPFPLYYDVDYFRYYQLNTQYCNTDALIINNTQLSNFIYGVRQNITIGNGTAAISLNSGESVTFRATNAVTINGDFTVPLGCELNIISTLCP